MDLVYTIGDGCTGDELRYSIRSMIKHLAGISRVVFVGHRPPGFRNIYHIPTVDHYPHNRARNIYEKILLACRESSVSENFICASDDHFIVSDFTTGNLPTYHDGLLDDIYQKLSDDNYYKTHVGMTMRALEDRGLPCKNFNVHFPAIYNKKLFEQKMTSFDWSGKKGYLAKSLFMNSILIDGENVKDQKIHTPKTKSAIYRRIAKGTFFSTNEHSFNDNMMEVLYELFPDRSIFEE